MLDVKKGLTLRSVVIGLGVVVFVDVWATYTEMYVRASRLTIAHFPLAVFATLLALLALNSLLRKLRITPLTPSELLVVLSMGLVGAVIPVEGVVGFLLGIISSLYYFASPENQWAEYYHPYLPQWLVPQGNDAIWHQFFDGVGLEGGIPWWMWLPPLFWWATFIGVTLWVSACIAVILRKQWVEYERLVYPLAAVALQMVSDPRERREPGALRRSRLFWAGAALPFVILCWEALSWFFPGLPLTGFFDYREFRFTRYSGVVVVNPFQFFTLGFGYFANVEVLFSVWSFFLVHIVEGSVFNRIGYTLKEAGSDLFCGNPKAMAWQGQGAFCFMVLWGLWIARRHLGDVFRKAFRGDPEVDDSGEMMSYRTAVWTGMLSGAYMFFWLHRSGMDYATAALFLVGTFVVYAGSARVVAEAGLLYTWAPVSPQSFVVNILGSSAISGPGMAAILLSYSLVDYLRGLFLPPLVHVARFADLLQKHRRRLLLAVVAGAGIGLAFAFVYTLNLVYSHGAYNTYGFPRFFGGDPKAIFSNTLSKVRNPFSTDWPRLVFAGIGAVVMGLLTLLRSRVSWWRIHPMGFAVASMINTEHLAIPLFLAWAIKSIILKVGGVQLYRRSTPLFVGLIVGYVLGVCFCFGMDALWFPQKGHRVHGW